MTSEFSKYLKEHLDVFFNVKQQNDIHKIMDFQAKTFLYNVMFYQVLMLFKFLKISYVLLSLY